MRYVAYCEGVKVASVYCRRFLLKIPSSKRWEICWHNRGDARERIANLQAAKTWVATLLHGKTVEWKKEGE